MVGLNLIIYLIIYLVISLIIYLIGVIAQDVMKVLPEIVEHLSIKNTNTNNSITTDNINIEEEIHHIEDGNRHVDIAEDKYIGVRYIELIPLLIEGIKELDSRSMYSNDADDFAEDDINNKKDIKLKFINLQNKYNQLNDNLSSLKDIMNSNKIEIDKILDELKIDCNNKII